MNSTLKIIVLGLLPALVAGMFIGLQATFNSSLEKRLGFVGLICWVHFVGFVVSVPLVLLFEPQFFKNLGNLRDVPIYVPFSGALGLVIIVGITMTVSRTNPAIAFSLSMVGQMTLAMIVQHFGLLEVQREPISLTKVLALILIVAGVGLFFSNR